MKEEIIKRTKEILKSKDDRALCECLDLIEDLFEIGIKYEKEKVIDAFDDFFNYETLNYLSDMELNEFRMDKKWSKEQIINWLNQNNIPMEEEGVYNVNSLVLGMNYEYSVHKNFIEKQEDKAMTAYCLAEEALHSEGYVDAVLEKY